MINITVSLFFLKVAQNGAGAGAGAGLGLGLRQWHPAAAPRSGGSGQWGRSQIIKNEYKQKREARVPWLASLKRKEATGFEAK